MKSAETTGDQDLHYDGRITDVAIDGSVDYKNRPADKARTGRWTAVSFIMGSVLLERLTFFGIALNLISYLTTVLHEGTAESITSVWNWNGVAWMTPLIGGFIADAYLGRFKTIRIGLFIYLVGMVLLTLTVALPALKPPACPSQINCTNASALSTGLFYFALYIVATAIGGIKPCISALGADQFDEEDEKERPMKRSFFNYWWFSVNGGAALALTFLIYIEDHVGFGWGYGIPTVGMVFSIALFLAPRRRYRYKVPAGSPFTQIAQVLVAAARKFRLQPPQDAYLLHESFRPDKRNILHTNNFRFLDKAATVSAEDDGQKMAGGQVRNWRLCTVTQVEEVKLLVKVMPVWFATLMFVVTAQQLSTVFLRQGLTMDLRMGPHFKIPPASLELSCTLSVIVAIPLYDLYLVPFVRRFTGNERGFTLLQRIGIGLVMSVLGMAISAIVEQKRLHVVEQYGLQLSKKPLPLSVFWLTPQYSIMGLAQVFGYMGMLEFFYDQAPDDMQSMGTALFLSNTGVAHFLCTVIVKLVGRVTGRDGRKQWIQTNTNQSRLDKYFWLLTTMAAINCLFFFLVAYWYKYKQAERRYKDSEARSLVPAEAPVVV